MLTKASPGRGFTLVELLITISLMAILLFQIVPTFRSWSADSRVRSTAEALQNALRLAQSSAVARSRTSIFALTAAEPAWNAAPAANSTNWYLSLLPLPDSDEVASSSSLIQASTLARQLGVTIEGPALLCFNSMGQQASLASTATGLAASCQAPTDDVNTPTQYTVSRTGAARKLKVRVYLGGRVRMCDDAKTLSTTNPDGC